MWSFLTGSQDECMRRVADFYLAPGDRILDVSYGAGSLTAGLANVVGLDSDPESKADVIADSTDLPFPDASFDAAVFDPPYLYGRAKNNLHGRPNAAWASPKRSCNADPGEFTERAFHTAVELGRVVVPEGRVITKVMDARWRGTMVVNHMICIEAFETAGFETFDIICYLKPSGLFKQTRSAQPSHGYFLVFHNPRQVSTEQVATIDDDGAGQIAAA